MGLVGWPGLGWAGLAWVPGWPGDSHSAEFCSVSTSEPGRVEVVGALATNSCGEHKQFGLQSPRGGGCNFPPSPSKHVARPCVGAQLLLPAS